MKLAVTWVVLFFCACQLGSGPPNRNSQLHVRQAVDEARRLLAANLPAQARARSEAVLNRAQTAADYKDIARLATMVAASEIGLGRYVEAQRDLLIGRQAATRSRDYRMLAIGSHLLSVVYEQMTDYDSAAAAAQTTASLLQFLQKPEDRVSALIQLGRISAARGRFDEASAHFQSAVTECYDANLTSHAARALIGLGGLLLDRGHLDEADAALSQAYRLRLLFRDPDLYLTQFALAKLRLAQRDPGSAAHLLDSALEGARLHPVVLPEYHIHHLRANILEAQNDLAGALDSHRESLAAAARLRRHIALPLNSSRASTNRELGEVYQAFISAAIRRAAQTGDSALIAEAWQAAEQHRASSLRESILSSMDLKPDLPPTYWLTLASLRSLEARELSGPTPDARSEFDQLRLRLNELEAHAGVSSGVAPNFPENIPLPIALISLRGVLGSERILISYHLGAEASYRWVASTQGLEVSTLPPGPAVNQLAITFRNAILQNEPDAAELGKRLYSTLFDGIGSAATEWILALDGKLFEVPFAALVTSVENGHARYLVEQHTLEVVPGAWAVGAVNRPQWTGGFLAVADPIYNRADPRFPKGGSAGIAPVLALWNSSRRHLAELPRLVGSGHEAEACVRSWGTPSRLLTGADATRAKFMDALRERPAVIHLAGHFVPSARDSTHTMVALSLQKQPDGQPLLDLLTNTDVAHMQLPGSLVVMSGCSSNAGRALPVAGLLGLTRAWLTAGARYVIASQWAMPDDSGDLFQHFYKYLRAEPGPASPAHALRQAQLDMLHSSDWRANPRYWAAYLLTARSEGRL